MAAQKITSEILDSLKIMDSFPSAEDDDLIRLSCPPAYTAFPNPFFEDFLAGLDKNLKLCQEFSIIKPFAVNVAEGKNDAIYTAHSYHTKIPYKAVMKYILHYTNPGELVLDGFCGSGMTGVAAAMCGNPDPVFKEQVEKEMGVVSWGKRYAVLCDLSPSAAFIAHNYNSPMDASEFIGAAEKLLAEAESAYGWVYKTKHTIGGKVQLDAMGNPVQGRIITPYGLMCSSAAIAGKKFYFGNPLLM
ncbi:MAG: DNA methyltransferase [Bacillota bacterium]